MHFLSSISQVFAAHRQYFTQASDDLARSNLITMRITGLIGSIVTILFFIIAPRMLASWSITIEYYFIILILFGAFIFSFFYERRRLAPDPRLVTLVSIIFYTLLLANFIVISVFPYPDMPQIFISLCFMLMPALLSLRPRILLFLMISAEIIFLTLAIRYKSSAIVSSDIFNTMASLLVSLIIMITINHRNYNNYKTRVLLEKLSQQDTLTGLMNKRTFEECSAACLNDPTSCRNALLILDLDNFKNINDLYGHPFGDMLLAAVGDVLLQTFRQTDLVGRIGGDEFAVLLRGVEDSKILEKKCAELCNRLTNIKINNMTESITCSMGAILAPDPTYSYNDLFLMADEALYQGKRQHKGWLVIHE